MMLDITYYYVEQLVRPETGWARQMPRGYENYNNGFQDKAQAEKFLQEETERNSEPKSKRYKR